MSMLNNFFSLINFLFSQIVKKKFLSLLIVLYLFLTTNCILFKNSELDNDSELSKLYGLLLLSNFLKGVEYETTVKFLENGAINGSTVIKVSKVPRDYTIPIPNQEDTSGEFIGTFQQASEGFHRLYFRDLGRFRLDIYKFSSSPTYHGSLVIDLLSSTDKAFTIVQEAYPDGYKFIEQNLTRITKRDYEPYEVYITEDPKPLGTHDGKAFYSVEILFNKDYNLSVGNIRIGRYILIFYTSNGQDYQSFVIVDANSDAAAGTQNFDIQYSITTRFATEDSLVLVIRKTVASVDSYFFAKIPFSQPDNYTFYSLSNRSIYNTFNNGKFFYNNGKMIYKETDGTNSEWRIDNNLLQSGSSNTAIVPGANSPFNYSDGTIFQYKELILNYNGSSYYISNFDLSDSSNTFSHSSPLVGPSIKLITNNYKFFLEEVSTSPSDVTRYSTSNTDANLPASNLSFSGGYQINQVTTQNGSIFNSEKTAFEFIDGSSLPLLRIEFNHSDNTVRETQPQPKITQISGYTTGGELTSLNKCNIISSLYSCVVKREYSGTVSLYDPFLIYNYSADSINWTDWKELKLNPIVRSR
ncbi:MAG: hypothetical protein GW761_07645 [Leptospira sp.]|nr:hypothetical protein [Leptospira sp.]